MLAVRIDHQIYKVDLEPPVALHELCWALIQQGAIPYYLCGVINETKNISEKLTPDSLIDINSDLIFKPPVLTECISGEDYIGKWICVFRKKLVRYIKKHIQNDIYVSWDGIYSDVEKHIQNDICVSWDGVYSEVKKNLNTSPQDIYQYMDFVNIELRFYPQKLFYTVLILGDTTKKYNTFGVYYSMLEAINIFKEALNQLQHTNESVSRLNPSGGFSPCGALEISMWAEKHGLLSYINKAHNGTEIFDICKLNFSQIILVIKKKNQINFYDWDQLMGVGNKIDLKFHFISEGFVDSVDFSIKAGIYGRECYIYELLELGDQDLNNFSEQQKRDFLVMLIDSWKHKNCGIIIADLE